MCLSLFRIYFWFLSSDHNLKMLLLNQYCFFSTNWFSHLWRPFTSPVSLWQFSIANKRVGKGLLNLAYTQKVLVLSYQDCNTSNFLQLLGEHLPFLGQLPPDNLYDQMMVSSQDEEGGRFPCFLGTNLGTTSSPNLGIPRFVDNPSLFPTALSHQICLLSINRILIDSQPFALAC